MESMARCNECGVEWSGGQTCTGHFHTLLGWELEHQLYEVHYLLVLCYHLQHPSLYSPEGLSRARQMLIEFLEEGLTPSAMLRRISREVDSGVRSYKIKGMAHSHGDYQHPVEWTMTVADVAAGGPHRYYGNVRRWADSILTALRESSNLAKYKGPEV